jgi:hypothetical protein
MDACLDPSFEVTRSLDNNACFRRRAVRRSRVFCLKAGRMPCGSCNRKGLCGRSGITSVIGGVPTRGCVSITFCSRRHCESDSWMAGWTDGSEARTTPAIMLRDGSCWILDAVNEYIPLCHKLPSNGCAILTDLDTCQTTAPSRHSRECDSASCESRVLHRERARTRRGRSGSSAS